MKAKYVLAVAMLMIGLPLSAQETYQSTKLIGNDLNGTARYVGMGGAMEALGADLSTMSTNPAGIGLFRRSQAAISGGFVAQSGEDKTFSIGNDHGSIDGNNTNGSLDQVGFVWAQRVGSKSFLNLGFGYRKSRNFDQILTAVNGLHNASLNKLTAMKYNEGLQGDAWNGVDASYGDLLSTTTGADGTKMMDYLNGTAFGFGQYQHGYIGEYDFNVSGNIHDRFYFGLTFGIHDVNYRSEKYYTENLENSNFSENRENLKIDGTGFDAKFGVIFRPIEESPFRIGLYVNTPVFYDLTQRNTVEVALTDATGNQSGKQNSADYDFRVNTPWKFGISLGHTISNVVALGATYEYSKYSAIDNRIKDGGYVDDGWWGVDYVESSSSDDVMNHDTELNLKGVHTFKFGLEVKPIENFAIRAGYNYVSPVFKDNAYRDGSLYSPGVGYATSADYTNWKATNRFTFGLGYTFGKWFVDGAYQYSHTNGDFYPFMPYTNKDADYNNVADATKVSFKRSQVLFTLGYRF